MKKILLLAIMMIATVITTAQIIHVPGDYDKIQDAIDAANFWGDTVLVDEGTYFENIDFSNKFITVASHYILDGDTNHINNTIIDGSQAANPDYGSVVSFQTGEDTTSILCGFTITGGTGTWILALNIRVGGGISIHNCGAKIIYNHVINNHIVSSGDGSGGGIAAGDPYNEERVVIKYNRISNNSITADGAAEGGGILLYCNGIIEHNKITNNEIISANDMAVGAGVRCIGASASGTKNICVNSNIISGNLLCSESMQFYGFAGGIQAYNCTGIISNNKIQFNKTAGPIGSFAGGMHCGNCGPSLIVSNNLITDNSSNYGTTNGLGGGIYLSASSVIFINNVIARNYADYGAGVYQYYNKEGGGPTQFINNTIANNEWGANCGGIYLKEAEAIVLNTILWNESEEIYLDNGNVEVAYSDVYDGWPGEGNIDLYPVFIDDSCHLDCATPSPCIEKGIVDFTFSGTIYNAPMDDFEGDIRPMDVDFDIGADESKICTGLGEISMSDNINLTVNPNPSSGALHLRYQIPVLSGVVGSEIRNVNCIP